MPLSETQTDEIAASIKLARKRALNFGLCLSTKPEETVLLIDKIKPPAALQRNAKKEGSSPKLASGLLEVDGRVVSLTCEDRPPSGLAKGMRKFFKACKLKLVVQILDQGGTLLDEDQDDDDVPDQGAVAAETVAPSEPPERPVLPDQVRFDAAVVRLSPIVEKIQGSAHPNAEKVAAVWTLAHQRADAGDHPGGVKALLSIPPMLAAPQSAQPNTAPAPEAAKWQAAAAKVAPRIAPFEARSDPPARSVVTAWGKLNAVAEAGQPERALAALPQLIKALVVIPPAPDVAPEAEPQVPPVDESPLGEEVLDLWDEATSITDRQLDALFSKIRAADDPAAAKIADLGLSSWSKGARTAVTKSLIKLRGKTTATVDAATCKEAAAAFRAYRQFIAMHPAVKMFEDNPYGLSVDLTGTLSPALAAMENKVSAT